MLNLELVSRIALILQDVAKIARCTCDAKRRKQCWTDGPGSPTAAGVWVGSPGYSECDGTCVHAQAKMALADIKAAVDAPTLATAISAATPEQIARVKLMLKGGR